MDRSKVASWLFSALSAQGRLDQMEREGVAVRPASSPGALQRALPLDGFPPEVRSDALQALPAYLAFFCLENSVRQLVMERMLELNGADWWSADGVVSKPIRDKVAKRQDKEGRERWHARRGGHPIHYTDFGDLKSLIVNNFSDFEDLFPDQNWVTSRLDELELSRNIIAHSNVLEAREVDRLKIYMMDWIRQVG